MKLMVNAPTYWESQAEVNKKCWLYLKSCEKFGITKAIRRSYGVGSNYYHGEANMRIDGQIDFLKRHAEDFTHVLCTDAWDVLFTATIDEIIEKYKALGSPAYLSTGSRILMNIPPKDMPQYYQYFGDEVYRYPALSGYIAEIPYVIEMFTRMNNKDTHDSTHAYMKAWMEGWFRHPIDTQCVIFQDWADNCTVRDDRLFNTVTGTYPCVFHISGSYVRPDIGRDEQVLPWAKKLGILPDEDFIRGQDGAITDLMPLITEAARESNGFVLEIGPGNGTGSTIAIQEGLADHPRPLHISVDHQDYMIVKPKVDWWEQIIGDSREPHIKVRVRSITRRTPGLIFIDTDHNYEQMKAELPVWIQLADHDTVWLFHDTHMHGTWNRMNDAIIEFAVSTWTPEGSWVFEDWKTESHGLGRMRWIKHPSRFVGLNIGSGQRRYGPGWLNIDSTIRPPDQIPDLVCNVGKEKLPFDDGSVDYCVLHHLYEHLDADDGHRLVAECYRVLKVNGVLIITVPDMRALAQRWMLGQIDDYIYFVNVYGAYQGMEEDRHKRGFHQGLLKKDLLECAPWSTVKAHDWRKIPGADIAKDWWILGVEAIK